MITVLLYTLQCIFWRGYRLPELEFQPKAGVADMQGMFTPQSHLFPPLVSPEVPVWPIFKFVLPTGRMRLMTIRYLCYYIFLINLRLIDVALVV
jgi:hypothetical protein